MDQLRERERVRGRPSKALPLGEGKGAGGSGAQHKRLCDGRDGESAAEWRGEDASRPADQGASSRREQARTRRALVEAIVYSPLGFAHAPVGADQTRRVRVVPVRLCPVVQTDARLGGLGAGFLPAPVPTGGSRGAWAAP